jgi:hypothetical protein
MACTKLRTGSCVLLGLAFLSWFICLGGLGSMNWCGRRARACVLLLLLHCSAADDRPLTIPPLAMAARRRLVCTDSANTAAALGGSLSALGGASAVGQDIAVCSRSWRWEWW